MPEEDRRDESSGESKEILHIPKEQMEEFLAKTLEHIKKIKEETEGQIRGLREEVDNLKKRPLEEYVAGFDREIGENVAKKIAHAEIEKKSREAVDSAVLGVKQILESEARSRVIEASNRVYGTKDKTLEDSIRTQEEKRFWSKIRYAAFAVGGISILSLVAYSRYEISQRTAESATGIAQEAKKIANKSLEDLKNYKIEFDSLQKKNEEDKKKENEIRKKERDELEQKLAGQIRAKADKTEYDARFADLKKDNYRLDGMLQAELKKNEGREDAYVKYKELADATKALVDSTKSTLDELVKNYREFEKEVATKENIEIKIATIRDAIENEIKQRIKDYDNLITRMQEVYNKNDEEIKKFRGLLNNIEDSYKEIEKRVQKLEEKREKWT